MANLKSQRHNDSHESHIVKTSITIGLKTNKLLCLLNVLVFLNFSAHNAHAVGAVTLARGMSEADWAAVARIAFQEAGLEKAQDAAV